MYKRKDRCESKEIKMMEREKKTNCVSVSNRQELSLVRG